MKAIIMAAGKGTRISRYIGNQAKCTLDIGGITLIENTINALKKKNIRDIAVILGYAANQVTELIGGDSIKIYYNPFYDVTNSIASLWFARDFINNDDLLLLNGDVFFEDRLLDLAINEKKTPLIFADESRREVGDYKLYYENNILIKYGKELFKNDATAEYIGMMKIGKEFIPKFINRLENFIAEQRHNLWWENIIYSMSSKVNIYVKDINRIFWTEIDYIEDYDRVLKFVKHNKINKEKFDKKLVMR